MEKFLAVIGGVVSGLAALALAMLTYGWVLSILWSWFMVPALHLPRLSISAAIGITITVRCMLNQSSGIDTPKRTTSERITNFIGYSLLGPLVVLVIGWAIHLFM